MASKIIEMPIRLMFGISGLFQRGFLSGFSVVYEDPRDLRIDYLQIWYSGNSDGTNLFKKVRFIEPDEGESRIVWVEKEEVTVSKGFFSKTETITKKLEIEEILIRRDNQSLVK